jgi:hypothetical protein
VPLTFGGFPTLNIFTLAFGLVFIGANVAMMLVSIGKPSGALGRIDGYRFPPIKTFTSAGESCFTYKGRVLVDTFIIFSLWFFLNSFFLGLVMMLLLGAATYIKERETALFAELFREPDLGYGVAGGEGPIYGTVDDDMQTNNLI